MISLKAERRKQAEDRSAVEEKFGEQNFRVLSEMRILDKIRVAILDFGRVCRNFSGILSEIRF